MMAARSAHHESCSMGSWTALPSGSSTADPTAYSHPEVNDLRKNPSMFLSLCPMFYLLQDDSNRNMLNISSIPKNDSGHKLPCTRKPSCHYHDHYSATVLVLVTAMSAVAHYSYDYCYCCCCYCYYSCC